MVLRLVGTDCELCKSLLDRLSLNPTVQVVGEGIESDPEVEACCTVSLWDRSLGNEPDPSELSPELITPPDPLPKPCLTLLSILAFLFASLSFVACLALSAISRYGFIESEAVIWSILSGEEGNLIGTGSSDLGEDRGREGVMLKFGSGEDGMNGIILD